MNKMRTHQLFVIFVAATIVLMAAAEPSGQTTFPRPSIVTDFGQVHIKDINTKIESGLYKLIHPEAAFNSGHALTAAGVFRIDDTSDETAQVIVEVTTALKSAVYGYPEVHIVRNMIAALGGVYETSFENFVQCRIPLALLENIAQSDFVRFIRRPLCPIPQVVSEGVAKTGANEWHSMVPYRSTASRPRIAVLDLGFKGYANLLGGDLPSNVTTRSFRADNDLLANQIHGAACAEIVYDMYPNADLYLVNFSTEIEQHNAVNWLIGQGVEIISYSIGWWNSGDGKGTGPINEDVKKAAASGIAWVSSAGNYA